MQSRHFHIVVGSLCVALFAAFFLWQTPGLVFGKLAPADIDRYLAAVDRQIPMAESEKPKLLQRLRVWAEADDGGPVYMLNLMRYYDELRRFPGAPEFGGTPTESNDHYEKIVRPLLFAKGGYLMVGGRVQGANVVDLESNPALDHWSRVLVVRYPSRRAFLELLADPAYAPMEPYKFMALQAVLVPVSAEMLIPDLRLLVGGGLLLLYLAVGWFRAARAGA